MVGNSPHIAFVFSMVGVFKKKADKSYYNFLSRVVDNYVELLVYPA